MKGWISYYDSPPVVVTWRWIRQELVTWVWQKSSIMRFCLSWLWLWWLYANTIWTFVITICIFVQVRGFLERLPQTHLCGLPVSQPWPVAGSRSWSPTSTSFLLLTTLDILLLTHFWWLIPLRKFLSMDQSPEGLGSTDYKLHWAAFKWINCSSKIKARGATHWETFSN